MVVDFYKTPVISAHEQNDRYIEYGVSAAYNIQYFVWLPGQHPLFISHSLSESH